MERTKENLELIYSGGEKFKHHFIVGINSYSARDRPELQKRLF